MFFPLIPNPVPSRKLQSKKRPVIRAVVLQFDIFGGRLGETNTFWLEVKVIDEVSLYLID
jgi:hypothetical protein